MRTSDWDRVPEEATRAARRGRRLMRVSVSDRATDHGDVDRAVAAFLQAASAAAAAA